MAITSLRFYKGSFTEETNYVDGGIYFDNTTRQIRVGKGGVDSFEAFGGNIKDVTFINSKLTISFNDERQDVIVDLSTMSDLITILSTKVNNIEDKVETLEENIEVIQVIASSALTKANSAYNLADAKIASISTGSALSNTGTAKNPVINVKLSDKSNNTLSIEEDGLYSSSGIQTDYTVSVTPKTTTGLAKKYILEQKGVVIGEIDIPKDMVVESGTVRKPTPLEAEEYGVDIDENYIILTLANVEDHPLIFIPTTDLIQNYTSGSQVGDPVVITISSDHKISASLTTGAIGVTYLDSSIQSSLSKAHTHENKNVIDSITAARVTSWDSAASKEDIVFNTPYDKNTNKAATMADMPKYASTKKAGLVRVGSGLVVTSAEGILSVDPDIYKVKDIVEGEGIGINIKETNKYEIGVKIDNNTIKTNQSGELFVDTSVIVDVPIATPERTGIVRAGGDISVDSAGDMWMLWNQYVI